MSARSELPAPVRARLVRALGAFLKVTPAVELPASVRRFRTFDPKALLRHEGPVLDLLDDEVSRKRILEWLDDGHTPLSKEAEATLRTAAVAEPGWEEALGAGAAASKPDGVDRSTELERAVEREKTKAKKAREDARKAKEALAEAGAAAEARASAAEAARAKLEEEKVALSRALAEEVSSHRSSAEASERRLRKAKKHIEKLRAEKGDLKAEAKELRRRIAELEAEKASRSPERRPKRKQASSPPEPTGPRKALPAPKGLLQDAPETLDSWLGIEGAHLVVDGYNVTLAEGGYGGLVLQQQRDRLIEEVAKLVRRKKSSATIVFDGNEVPPGAARLPRGPVKVEYSRPDEIADDHIVALVEGLPPHPVIVATNDRELQERVAALGATVAISDQLLALIR